MSRAIVVLILVLKLKRILPADTNTNKTLQHNKKTNNTNIYRSNIPGPRSGTYEAKTRKHLLESDFINPKGVQ